MISPYHPFFPEDEKRDVFLSKELPPHEILSVFPCSSCVPLESSASLGDRAPEAEHWPGALVQLLRCQFPVRSCSQVWAGSQCSLCLSQSHRSSATCWEWTSWSSPGPSSPPASKWAGTTSRKPRPKNRWACKGAWSEAASSSLAPNEENWLGVFAALFKCYCLCEMCLYGKNRL